MPVRSTLDALLREAEAIRDQCAQRHNLNTSAIKLSGRQPSLPNPDAEWLLGTHHSSENWDVHRSQLLASTLAMIDRAKQHHIRSCQRALLSTVSLANDGIPDAEAEERVIMVVEAAYRRHLLAIRKTLESVLIELKRRCATITHKKPGSFTPESVHILEAAFTRCSVLSQRECSIVAKAAGITHQQVRTWFQNKRNRKRGGTRIASTANVKPEEDFIPPSNRIISSLPKRARQAPTPTEPTRPLRGLPKRAKIPSPSPSSSSISTVESIAPAGGFQSTFTGLTDMPTLSFDGTSLFDPSTLSYPLLGLDQTLMPLDGSMEYATLPIYDGADIDGLFNPEEFGNMLQEALADPTLGASPTFTTFTSSTSPRVVPDDATKEAIDNMSGEELFAMLEDLLSKSNHSTSTSVEGSEVLASGELDAMDPETDEISPLDLSILSFPSSSTGSPSGHAGSGPSTQAYHNPTPIEVAPVVYPSLNIYPATPRAAHVVPASYSMAYGAQAIPTMQPRQGAWIPGALPFDGHETYYPGAWMMDGQGYTHPPRTVPQGVVARG